MHDAILNPEDLFQRPDSAFRAFCGTMYQNHLVECDAWGDTNKYPNEAEYFKKNKWFLKKEFKRAQ